jgi:hypothetical protein
MVRTGRLVAALALTAASLAFPQAAGPARDAVETVNPNHEEFDYSIEWRLVSAGSAKLSWATVARPGAAVNEVRLHLESAGLVSRLFRVEDDYTAELGQGLCAQATSLTAHEGNRNKETHVIFDSLARKATWTEKDLVKNVTNNQSVEIPGCVHDVLSALMVLRRLRLEPGKTAQIPISDGKKFLQARVESQRREDVKTPLDTFHTIRYEVFLFDNQLYKRPGHMHVWLTDDDRRLPVQLQVRLQFAIGTITFRLTREERS